MTRFGDDFIRMMRQADAAARSAHDGYYTSTGIVVNYGKDLAFDRQDKIGPFEKDLADLFVDGIRGVTAFLDDVASRDQARPSLDMLTMLDTAYDALVQGNVQEIRNEVRIRQDDVNSELTYWMVLGYVALSLLGVFVSTMAMTVGGRAVAACKVWRACRVAAAATGAGTRNAMQQIMSASSSMSGSSSDFDNDSRIDPAEQVDSPAEERSGDNPNQTVRDGELPRDEHGNLDCPIDDAPLSGEPIEMVTFEGRTAMLRESLESSMEGIIRGEGIMPGVAIVDSGNWYEDGDGHYTPRSTIDDTFISFSDSEMAY
jgi:hypothetical protein